MRAPTTTVERSGASDTPGTFSLTGHRRAWIVESGALEVFAVRHVGPGEAGALQPVMRAGPGEAVFSMPADDRLGLTLVAKRSPDSQVAARVVTRFGDVIVPGSEPGCILDLLEDWIVAFSRAAQGDPLPRNAEAVTPDTPLLANEEPRVLTANRGLLWVRQVSGRSHVWGRTDTALAADGRPFPLSPASWVEVQPGSEARAADTLSILLEGGLWDGLDAFHAYALAGLMRRLQEADAAAEQRFRERARADAASVAAALRDLASPLTGGRDGADAAIPHAADTPLLRSCQAIGRVLGVTMKPHPDMLRGRPVSNPVASIAQASGVRYRRVALKDDWWTQGSDPLLVFRNDDHRPAALLPRRSRRGYVLVDPETTGRTRLDASAAATLNPFGFMFYRPFPETALTPRALLAFGLEHCRRDLLTILAVGVASGLLSLLLPIVTGEIFDSLIPNAQRSQLLTMSALLVVAAVATALFNLTRGVAVLRLQGRLSARLQAGLWDRLLRLPVPFFREYAAGDLADRSLGFAQIRLMLTGATLSAILSGLASIFNFALLFYYSWRLALLATLLTSVAMAATFLAGTAQLRLQRRIVEAGGRIAGRVVEFVSGIAKFRVAGAEQRAFVLWVRDFARQKRLDFQARAVASNLTVFNSIYLVFCLGVLFYANSGVEAWRDQPLSTGRFLAFVAAFSQFMTAALMVSGAVIGAMNVIPLYERALPILHTLPEDTAARTEPPELTGDVEALHLGFRYRSDLPPVLRDVSFHIRPGEYVAFVGPSGCGKSTLFRLLLGFERPESGAVYYEGQDLAGLDVGAVRRQIGVVLQSGTLVSGSIKDNICGAASIPIDDVWEAARLAGLEEDVKNMAMGLHTMVQAGGGGLSGGQRQRVLIARAVVGKPRLLMFDEATSALDNRTQAVVSASLTSLKTTRIVIAHRLSTILEADRIFVLDQGTIVQSGTYAELMRQPGVFRELAERQLTGESPA